MGVFRDTLTFDDFELVEGSTTDNCHELNSDNYTLAYKLEFEKGEGAALGQGRAANQTDAVGRLYHEIDADGASDITGYKVRMVVLNRQDNTRRVISQYTDTQITDGASDRSARQPFPVQERGQGRSPVFVAYPFALGLEYRLNSGTDNIDDAESGTTAEIDALRYEDTGGR